MINNSYLNSTTVEVLQRLIELESEYGVLPLYTPVIDDIITFINVKCMKKLGSLL